MAPPNNCKQNLASYFLLKSYLTVFRRRGTGSRVAVWPEWGLPDVAVRVHRFVGRALRLWSAVHETPTAVHSLTVQGLIGEGAFAAYVSIEEKIWKINCKFWNLGQSDPIISPVSAGPFFWDNVDFVKWNIYSLNCLWKLRGMRHRGLSLHSIRLQFINACLAMDILYEHT